ncbi:ABC transporter substrate-binding protein [Gordonia sp. ABSL1-1]|uniref:ABC transporter substrate-binding protein n=1 Tax=Gordonia sp. ABSL1-1 TaxID=3053923 RepID=UPI002572372B|nr:ABC transporter substrate-binding protein [Gordonia sp. ABSL1-1]MDL9938169.1 ABC transporter substrate-binding protein [Gordonia sp. ABSL1-1]
MRFNRHIAKGAVVVAAASLALAACSSDDDSSDASGNDNATYSTDCGDNVPVAQPGPVSTEPLKIGTLLPETGSLAFLGPPEVAGVKLGIKEVNAAGGVLGKPIQQIDGDSGDDTTDTANITVDRLLSDGTQVIVGAASSAVSLKVIDKIANAGTVMFSPANTSDQFICYPDKGQYFRTAPTDTLQAQALAQVMADDGVQRVSILARNEAYGTGLAANTVKELEAAGIPADQIQKIIYDPNAQSFNAEIDQVKNFNPDGIAVIGFDESAKIITRMNEVGIGPNQKKVYGTDGNMGNALGEAVGPGLLAGMKGTTPLTDTGAEFERRIRAVDPNLEDLNYSGESYDAVVISALAAEIAKSTNGRSIASEINGVTRDGTKCKTYDACLALVKEGKDIDYDGVTGELTFTKAGEPSVGSYGVLVFGPNNKLSDDITYKVVRS